MYSALRSKWLMAVVLLFAAFGVLAALSIVPTPFFGGASWDSLRGPGKFVPVAYAGPAGEDFGVLERANRALVYVVNQTRQGVVRIQTEAGTQTAQRRSNPEEQQQERRGFRFQFPFDWPDVPEGRGPIIIPPRTGIGSGVIVSTDGYILTSNHVVEGAERMDVRLDNGRELRARLIGRDPQTDLAVAKVDAKDLPALALGDSDALEVGEFVIAIGTPFDKDQSVSLGIVSAKGRHGIMAGEESPYEDFIQTDAAINPGNSGGPLVNIRGEVVGINTAINSRTGVNEGVGFAIPINLAKKVMTDLIEKGKVVRAWLGVWIGDVSPNLAEELRLGGVRGAMVNRVFPRSPADRAGIHPADIILEMDGDRVRNRDHFRNTISSARVGSKVRLTLLRDGAEKTVTVTLGELPEEERVVSAPRQTPDTANGWMGITVAELDSDRAKELGYVGMSGVLVTNVEPNSPAARERIEAGTLIMEIGGEPVKDLNGFRAAVKKAGPSVLVKYRSGEFVRLTVLKKE
jgi:serine protease Do